MQREKVVHPLAQHWANNPRPVARFHKALVPIAFLGLFALYAYCAYPTVSPYRDSGDLAAAACVFGVAHAPGYPLYVALGHLWEIIFPFGNPAYRLHVLSALMSVCASAVLFRVARRHAIHPTSAGVAAAAAFALSPAVWHLSLVSEMYTLLALCAAVLIDLASRPAEDGEPPAQRICLLGLLFGIGLAGHQTLMLTAPALLWMTAGRARSLKTLGFCAMFFLLGLAIYALLPLRSLADPMINWGEPHTWRNFWRMLTRADYGGIRLHPDRPAGFVGASQWLAGAVLGLKLIPLQLGWSGAAAAVWGAVSARRGRLAQALVIGFLISGPVFIAWANLDPAAPDSWAILEPHSIIPVVCLALLAGLGAADIFSRAANFPAEQAATAAFLIAGWIIPQREAAARLLGYRNDFSAWDYGRGVLAGMPPGSILLEPDDTGAFALSYLQACAKVRTDAYPVSFVRTLWGYNQLKRRHPELLPPWEIHSGQELYATVAAHNIAAGRLVAVDVARKSPIGYTPVAGELIYKLVKNPVSAADQADAARRGREWLARAAFRRPPEGGDFFTVHAAGYWSSAVNNLGILAQYAGAPDEAAAYYRKALSWRGDFPEAWNNIGNAYLEKDDLRGAQAAYEIAQALHPAAQVTYNLGRVYLMQEKYPEAEREFKRAIEDGNIPDARNDLGLVYFRTQRADEAIKIWEELLKQYPRYVTVLYNLGMGYYDLGRKDDAKAWFTLYKQNAAVPRDRAEADAWLKKIGK